MISTTTKIGMLNQREKGSQAAQVWMCKNRTKQETIDWCLRQPDDIDFVTGMTDIAHRWGSREWNHYCEGMRLRKEQNKAVCLAFNK